VNLAHGFAFSPCYINLAFSMMRKNVAIIIPAVRIAKDMNVATKLSSLQTH